MTNQERTAEMRHPLPSNIFIDSYNPPGLTRRLASSSEDEKPYYSEIIQGEKKLFKGLLRNPNTMLTPEQQDVLTEALKDGFYVNPVTKIGMSWYKVDWGKLLPIATYINSLGQRK